MSSMRVLLDTDIGTNIDDAIALWYLLHEPACELLGVTTVTGRPDVRAALARAICADAGRPEVPVVVGSADPLEGTQGQVDVPLADEAESATYSTAADDNDSAPDALGGEGGGDAVAFMAETIVRHPREVVLIAIGPLTNVARLRRDRPVAFGKLRAIIAMMGRFDGVAAARDTNLDLDPTAASIVLEPGVVPTQLVGLDSTESARFSESELRDILGDVARTRLDACLAKWFLTRREAVLHDPVTASAAVHPASFSWMPCRVHVRFRDDGKPRVEIDSRGTGPHRVLQSGNGDWIRSCLRKRLAP